MRRFVIVVDKSTEAEVDSIIKLLNASGYDWWHWLNDLWLMTTPSGDTAVSAVIEAVTKISNPKKVFITEVSVVDWIAFVPPKSREWLDQYWKARS
jgi:hypothetical protein